MFWGVCCGFLFCFVFSGVFSLYFFLLLSSPLFSSGFLVLGGVFVRGLHYSPCHSAKSATRPISIRATPQPRERQPRNRAENGPYQTTGAAVRWRILPFGTGVSRWVCGATWLHSSLLHVLSPPAARADIHARHVPLARSSLQ